MKKIIYIVATSLVLYSCKTAHTSQNSTPHASTPTRENTESGNKAFFNQILKNADFQQVKMNSQINVEIGKFIPALDTTIYIEKDKKVWLNATALFLNVARGIATPEGIKAQEKWNKTYIESDFAYLNQLLNVNFINYNALQNLLIGRAFVPINEKEYSVSSSEKGYVVKTLKPQSITVDGKTVPYQITLSYSLHFDLNYIVIDELSNTHNQLRVDYQNWENFGTIKLPKNVKIIIKGEKNSQIYIENTNFGFDKMETPYSVPSNYKKISIK